MVATFLFCPWRHEFCALFSLLSIIIILIWDCDLQFISQIFSFFSENGKIALILFCMPKMVLWVSFGPLFGTWTLNFGWRRYVNKKQITGCKKAIQEEKEIVSTSEDVIFTNWKKFHISQNWGEMYHWYTPDETFLILIQSHCAVALVYVDMVNQPNMLCQPASGINQRYRNQWTWSRTFSNSARKQSAGWLFKPCSWELAANTNKLSWTRRLNA